MSRGFLSGGVFVQGVFVLIPVYAPQEDASEVEKSMYYGRVTYQIERAKTCGRISYFIGDFNAKLGKNLVKNDIHDMSKNGKLLYQFMICILSVYPNVNSTSLHTTHR